MKFGTNCIVFLIYRHDSTHFSSCQPTKTFQENKNVQQSELAIGMKPVRDSTRRLGLGNKSPYEMINEEDEDMWALFRLLKMDLISPDEVHLMPDLFTLNK